MTQEQKKYYNRVLCYEGRWKITVQRKGVRKTFYSSTPGDKGRKECALAVLDWLADGAPANYSVRAERYNKNPTVAVVFQDFLQDKKLETADIYNIENRYKNHIRPLIGGIKILNLTVQDMKRVILVAHKEKKLSRKTLMNLRGDLSSFCTYLADANIRQDLSTTRIKIPRDAPASVKTPLSTMGFYRLFTQDKTLYNNTETEDYYIYAYRFQLLYGLRPGELMGLEWGDVDMKNGFVTINRAINAKGQLTTGKNDFSHRVLPLTLLAKELLQKQAQHYRENPRNKHERIFGDFGQICYRSRWKIYCEHNGIPYITPYELRHTFASVNKLLPLWILDVLMGHTHEGISLGTYAHALEGDMKNVAEQLDQNLLAQVELGRQAEENVFPY